MVMKKYLKLEEITPYKIASELADYVWEIVSRWDWFAKKTVGTQFANAIDSIAGNIAEGFGRYHKRDKQKFYYNSRGSVFESAHWAKKAYNRKLLAEKEYSRIIEALRGLPKEINLLIKYTEIKLAI